MTDEGHTGIFFGAVPYRDKEDLPGHEVINKQLVDFAYLALGRLELVRDLSQCVTRLDFVFFESVEIIRASGHGHGELPEKTKIYRFMHHGVFLSP